MSGDQTSGMEQLHCVVSGHVQGVGFRAFTRSIARRFDINGWVRNLPDGRSVEVVGEGTHDQLIQFVEHLRKGPSAARVTDLRQTFRPAVGEFTGFSVRH